MRVKDTSFKTYLMEFKKKIGASNVPNFNLFNYSSLFQNFLKEKDNFNFSLAKLSISDIIEQNFFDNLQNNEEMPSSGNKEKDIFASFIKNLFESSDFKNMLDANQNNTVDKEEFMTFINSINKNKDSDLSLEEMFDGIKDLKEGSLSNIFNIPTAPETSLPSGNGSVGGNSSAVGSSSAGNNSVVGGNNANNNTSNNTNSNINNTSNKTGNESSDNNTGTKPIKDMTSEELKEEKTNREGNLTNAQNNLTSVYDGSNDKIQTANTDLKTAKDAYDEAVKNDEKISNDIKREREENLKNIETKNSEIDTKKSEIAQKENDISSQESVIASDKSSLEALTSALNSLGSSDDEEKQKEINKKRESIKAQIKTLETKIKQEEEKLENLKTELTTLKNELKIEQDDLEALEKQRQEIIEKNISANCSEKTASALSDYNTAKTNLDEIKSTEEKSAKTSINEARESLNEVNKQINVKNAEKTKEDNTVKEDNAVEPASSSAFVERDVNYTNLGYYDDESGMSYLVIGPDDVKKGEKLPMLVFLHGAGEASFGKEKMLESSLPYTLLHGETMLSKEEFNHPQDFRGYIVFPQLPTSKWWWTNDKAEGCLRSIIGNLVSKDSKFEIDKERISLAGHSLGGKGAVYMAKKLEDIVKRVAVISGSKAPANIDASTIKIPVKGYYAAREGADYMAGEFRKTFGNENVVEMQFDHEGKRIKHGDTPGVAFSMDSDGSGRSDLFEWLFPDK